MIKPTWKKKLTDEEKLKKEVIDDLKDAFIKNYYSDTWNDEVTKKIFGMPNFDNIDWIHQFHLQDDYICYLINKSIITNLINEIENENKDCISILRNAIFRYKKYTYIEQPTEETSKYFISPGFVRVRGWISSAFQNCRTACLHNVIIPYLEWVVKELLEHGCFHARAEIVDKNEIKPIITKKTFVRDINFKRIENDVTIYNCDGDKISLSLNEIKIALKDLEN